MNDEALDLPAPVKMSRLQKWGIAVFLLAAVAALAWVYFRDEVLDDDSDLTVEVPALPAAKNALRFFDDFDEESGSDDASDLTDLISGRTPPDPEKIAEIVGRNGALIEALEKVAGAEHLRSDSSLYIWEPRMVLMDLAADFADGAARLARERGDLAEWRRLTTTLARAGILVVKEDPAALFSGMGMLDQACELLRLEAEASEAGMEALSALIGELEDVRGHLGRQSGWYFDNRYQALKAAILDERVALDQRPDDDVHYPRTRLQEHRTLNLLAEHLRAAKNEADRPYADVCWTLASSSAARVWPDDWKGSHLFANTTGAMILFENVGFSGGMVKLGKPSVTRMASRLGDVILLKAHIDVLRVSIALSPFHANEGRLPDTLSELVPEYLAEVPMDGFDGQALRYDRGRAVVWCIGRDLDDDGGVNSQDVPFRQMADPLMNVQRLKEGRSR